MRSSPAVLSWSRSGWRSALTGLLGLGGLVVAAFGWVGLAVGSWPGLAVAVTGIVIVVVSELVARRFRVVTTRGPRWQRAFHTDELDWHAVGLSLTRPPGTSPAARDRIVIHRADGSALEWPHPTTHGACLAELHWWQRAQAEFPRGELRGFPRLRPQSFPPAPPRHVHNLAGRWWKGILAALVLALAIVACVPAATATSVQAATAWLLLGGTLVVGALAAAHDAASSVRVEPDRIVHRRGVLHRTIDRRDVVGAFVLERPHIVSLGTLWVLMVLYAMLAGDGDSDGPDSLEVPTLLLRDGSAVPLSALKSRDAVRANELAAAVVA